MYERDLSNRSNNDAVVTIPPPARGRELGTGRFRPRVRRDGMTSLEIDIPRQGLTCCDRSFLACVLAVVVVLLVFHIVLYQTETLEADAVSIWLLPFLVIAGLFMVCVTSLLKPGTFTHVNVKITRHSYCQTRKGITWKSMFQITCLPSHFSDLESGQFVETDPKESEYVRLAGLRAEVATHETERSVTEYIKLGYIAFAHSLSHDEVEWLAEEINRFLRETR